MLQWFVRHPNASNLLMALLLILGLVSISDIVRSTFPQQPLNTLTISVAYPGAAANEVNQSVCLRLEDAVDQVDQIEEFRCAASANRALVTVEGVDGVIIDRLLSDVRTQVEAIDDLPAETEPAIINLQGTSEPVVSIAAYADVPFETLKDYAEDLRLRALQIEGVSKVSITGFTDRQLRISLDERELRRLKLAVSDIAMLLRQLNLDTPAGELNAATNSLTLRVEDERSDPESLAGLRLKSPRGGQDFLLGDIATITDTFEYPNQKTLFNNLPAAILAIEKNRSGDALDVLASIDAFVERERKATPGVNLAITADRASLVQDRLGMLVKNAVQGLILVILVLWLFFSATHALWVGLGLPVAFAGTFFVMNLTGMQFDMMTLVALLIVIGIIVDDAIVISENIVAHREAGADPMQASINGTLEVLPGVISSFFTTCAIFIPLAFLRGELGTVLKAVPIVMLMALTVSLLEAFLILPSHLRHSRFTQQQNTAQKWIQEKLGLWRAACLRMVELAIRIRYLGFGLLFSALMLSVSLLTTGLMGFSPLPELDSESIEARLLMTPSTPFSATQETIDQLLLALNAIDADLTPEQPDQQPLVRQVLVTFGTNIDAYESGDHVATITVDLLNPEIRTHTSSAIRQLWRDRFQPSPDVINVKFSEPAIGPQGKPLELQIQGRDTDAMVAATQDLQNWLRRYTGVFDVSSDLRPGRTEYRFQLLPGAQDLGITSAMLADQLRGAFNGIVVQEVQVGREKFKVTVTLAELAQQDRGALDRFVVFNPQGDAISLADIARITPRRTYSRYHRINGRNTVTVEANIDASRITSAAVLGDLQKNYIPVWQAAHPDVELQIAGEASRSAETLASMRSGFLLGFIAMYLLLALQFRSYIEPLVVLIIIPLSFTGVIAGHLLLGYNLTMPSILGFISLAGIVVNDSILLVTFVEKRLGEGQTLHDAVTQASADRFRAVLLTSITTVAGLLPLLLETSLQAKVVIPLAISLAFGLTAATALVLFVIPAFYMVLHDFGLFHRHDSLRADA
jgi:hydrophobic/amphiphilic exporter-1 (mainly G- bacteria), HAE1 family